MGELFNASWGVGCYAASLLRVLRRVNPSILHLSGLKPYAVGALVARIHRVPIVWHLHDFLGAGLWEFLLCWLARRNTSRIICNSNAVRETLVARKLDHKATTIYCGLNLIHFSPSAMGTLRKKLALDANTILVGLVGMLTPWKGQEVFLQAVAKISRSVPNTRFLLIGDEVYQTAGHGQFRSKLERLVCQLGLQDIVLFTGLLDDMPGVLTDLNLVIHASVQPEPFGRVVMEAMACGRPVIATACGGIPEVLGADGTAGLLVPSGDSHALAHAMLDLIRAPARREMMGCAGRNRAEALFDMRYYIHQVTSAYESILRNR